ncbi:HTH-type transcriptional activator IlvY [Pseudomaricurvus sp. HS19]|uniref:HTH-type transcriptional activator IlvY n=1 Tax=Pseudomaricurvus sp. HS19 TaxID=2692626 RepID=UPI001370E411|nr:HTH-type transcriptional activator IlvY [Pseudomaricurvus sp. HS19]MYM65115.1 HTH-type transcriptional activator IlvY [Pseudomaricurvus sp. HS19]
MDTRSLRLFLSLSDTLHFGRSSEELHISPSALSRSIKQLEEKLGVVLFERDNRRVALTHEGKLLQTYARDTLQEWDAFRESLMNDSQQLRGEISIYCSVTASYSFLYDILSDFRRQHPGIELKIHTGDPEPGIHRVLNGQEDIAIVARPERLPANLAFRRITVSPLLLIGPAEASDNLPYNPPNKGAEWANTPMILPEDGLSRDRVDQWFRSMNIKPRIYAQVTGHEAMVSMVSLGFGIGVVPKIVLDNSPLADRVQVLDTPASMGHYDVGLCTLKKRLKSPIIEAFWN